MIHISYEYLQETRARPIVQPLPMNSGAMINRHPFHLVDVSPWPILSALLLLEVVVCLVIRDYDYQQAPISTNTTITIAVNYYYCCVYCFGGEK